MVKNHKSNSNHKNDTNNDSTDGDDTTNTSASASTSPNSSPGTNTSNTTFVKQIRIPNNIVMDNGNNNGDTIDSAISMVLVLSTNNNDNHSGLKNNIHLN